MRPPGLLSLIFVALTLPHLSTSSPAVWAEAINPEQQTPLSSHFPDNIPILQDRGATYISQQSQPSPSHNSSPNSFSFSTWLILQWMLEELYVIRTIDLSWGEVMGKTIRTRNRGFTIESYQYPATMKSSWFLRVTQTQNLLNPSTSTQLDVSSHLGNMNLDGNSTGWFDSKRDEACMNHPPENASDMKLLPERREEEKWRWRLISQVSL